MGKLSNFALNGEGNKKKSGTGLHASPDNSPMQINFNAHPINNITSKMSGHDKSYPGAVDFPGQTKSTFGPGEKYHPETDQYRP